MTGWGGGCWGAGVKGDVLYTDSVQQYSSDITCIHYTYLWYCTLIDSVQQYSSDITCIHYTSLLVVVGGGGGVNDSEFGMNIYAILIKVLLRKYKIVVIYC